VGALNPVQVQAVGLGHLVDQGQLDAAPRLPLIDKRVADRQELRPPLMAAGNVSVLRTELPESAQATLADNASFTR
jgi:hypothetical protein